MKILAILLDLVWIAALVILILTSGEGSVFKNDYIPIVLFSFIGVVFLNLKAFKKNAK